MTEKEIEIEMAVKEWADALYWSLILVLTNIVAIVTAIVFQDYEILKIILGISFLTTIIVVFCHFRHMEEKVRR